MSTENTQTDASAESTSAQTSHDNTSPSPTMTMDSLKQAAKASAEGVNTPPAEAAVQTPVIPATPAYQPNFKYRAALQEKEIEEFWRPLIKDEDSEKRVKELMTRVDGFDFVKQSRDQLQDQFKTLETDYKSQSQVVNRVTGALQKGDLNSAFRQLGLSDEAIFRYTQERLQRMEMPPDQRRAFEEADSLKSQQEMMQEQMTQYQTMYEQQAVQARTLQLDFALSRPEIASMAHNWDNLQGHSGAFKNLVIQEAQNAYYTAKVDLTPEQAVQAVMQKFGKVLSSGGQSQQVVPQAPAQLSQTPQVTSLQMKPVIPNINGKGAAPIKRVPKSLDDLRQLGKEAALAESR